MQCKVYISWLWLMSLTIQSQGVFSLARCTIIVIWRKRGQKARNPQWKVLRGGGSNLLANRHWFTLCWANMMSLSKQDSRLWISPHSFHLAKELELIIPVAMQHFFSVGKSACLCAVRFHTSTPELCSSGHVEAKQEQIVRLTTRAKLPIWKEIV